MKMRHLQNVQLFETCIETGNLQSYDEQSMSFVRLTSESQSNRQPCLEPLKDGNTVFWDLSDT